VAALAAWALMCWSHEAVVPFSYLIQVIIFVNPKNTGEAGYTKGLQGDIRSDSGGSIPGAILITHKEPPQDSIVN